MDRPIFELSSYRGNISINLGEGVIIQFDENSGKLNGVRALYAFLKSPDQDMDWGMAYCEEASDIELELAAALVLIRELAKRVKVHVPYEGHQLDLIEEISSKMISDRIFRTLK